MIFSGIDDLSPARHSQRMVHGHGLEIHEEGIRGVPSCLHPGHEERMRGHAERVSKEMEFRDAGFAAREVPASLRRRRSKRRNGSTKSFRSPVSVGYPTREMG